MKEQPDVLDRWVHDLCATLNLEEDIDVDSVLDVARVVAHTVERRAAPLTTYLMGLAASRGEAAPIARQVIELARTYRNDPPSDGGVVPDGSGPQT